MPYIQIDVSKITAEQKVELIEKLTATAHEVLGLPAQAFTVIIRETTPDNVGVGGKQLSQMNK